LTDNYKFTTEKILSAQNFNSVLKLFLKWGFISFRLSNKQIFGQFFNSPKFKVEELLSFIFPTT